MTEERIVNMQQNQFPRPAVTDLDVPGEGSPGCGWGVRRGKVRNVYDLGEQLLLVATDRISAFDVVLDPGIPDKGTILTQMSSFWFGKLGAVRPNHIISTHAADLEPPFAEMGDVLRGRVTLCRKTKPLPVECVVRGYLAGSGWKDYTEGRPVSGHALPAGLKESDRFPEPLFTPSSKATEGHDLPMSFDEVIDVVGKEVAETVRDRSIQLYTEAAEHAHSCGIILADTKFEFGWAGDELLLIDEIFTPDSSRFWPADEYEPGRTQHAFDKQFVRDYLNTLDWDKTPPPPRLPDEIVTRTRDRYMEAYRRLVGAELDFDHLD